MEAKAFDFLQAKDWVRAAEAFNELLALKLLTKGQIINYLLHRSECFSELDQHEAAVADCRRIINIADPADGNGSKARNRLIKSLVLLRRFSEAELATQEWVSVQSGPNHKVATKFLEHLHKALQSNGHSKSVEAEILARLHAFDPKMERNDEQVFVCTYCSVLFRDKMELRGHCQTEGHQRVIMSDEGRDWHWRPPPRGFTVEAYTLCDGWAETGNCRYGLQCVEAHGIEELKEWRDRFEYRRMKLQRAYESELYGKSYTEEFIEKLVQTTSPDKVMREKLPDIEDTNSNKLAVSISWKNSRQDWMFTLTSHSGGLRAVALLQDTHRNYFKIEWIQFAANGHWHDVKIPHDGQEWIYKPETGIPLDTRKFRVSVIFGADIYGTFRQSVIFDFGTEPVLVKHLCVDVIPVTDVEKINEIRKEVVLSSSERWNHMNSEIVQFSSPLTSLLPSYGNTESDWAKRLTSAYPCPHAESFDLSQATIVEKRLTRNNYKARMHELLYVEEMARYERVARYNVNTKLRITHSYLLCPNSTASSTAKYSSCGELFALMHLGKDLSEDTSAGRLILNNCTTIFLALDDPNVPRHKVYEALIEDKGKTMIYLRLSTQTVTELSLVPDQEVKFNVQFQLNRIPYCEWHYAIDKIPDFKVVFPDTYLEPNIPWTPARQWSDSLDGRLNLKQKEAIVAITTPLYVCLPPVLIIGPFGTGKTFTLAQAIKQLIAQPENRILICTQSNSAADLYIKDYLHPYVEAGHEEARPLRIYYHKRWVATVNQVVQKYCLIESGPGGRSFRVPSVEDILKHRIVVVTLSISMYLSTMDLPRGFFTHIFLDEAAQAMECEAIMPLALANQNTRIVLAGDHMQLSPELFSQFAKDRGLHVSLLERLYDHYPAGFPCKILLSENYRAHEAIINFTSESFYDQKLISSGKQPRHEIYYPLTFFTTRGEDVQDLNSTAFYNNSEVYEIVERVLELKKHWPNIWGKFDDHSIGIMTPYSDQVLRIRSELRKRQLFGISVERVLNVQGKQFRAIFLSTVRTRRTCKSGDDVDFGFLSNSKLLNTAITRAQSLVAVVGDPIALCSIGKCSKVWERFLQICEDNKSLFGITWLSIRNQLDGVELKKTYVLNPLAPEFIPRKYKEQYIRAQLIPEINIPPIPPPNKNPGLPFKIPIYPIIPTNFIPVRPIPPMPPWLPLHPRPFPKEQIRHMIPPPPPNKPEEKNLIQFFNNVHFPECKQQQQHQQPPPPPQPQQPPPPPHPPQQLPPQNPLKEYITLLPPNMSLADMILQPYNQQASWFYYLLEHKGIEAAKKFEYLIHTTTKKENVKLIPQVPNHCIKPVIPMESSSMPLYKRQSEKEPPPRQQELTQIQLNERQVRQQEWQQQINADFANLSFQNGSGDSSDDIFKPYNVSYASVVRTQKPFEEPRLVNGVNCESLNGPRLYQYF